MTHNEEKNQLKPIQTDTGVRFSRLRTINITIIYVQKLNRAIQDIKQTQIKLLKMKTIMSKMQN